MKSYNREKDGTTYYYLNEMLVGHPTNADGTCDFSDMAYTPVEDYAEPLAEQEIKEIEDKLAN